MANQKMGVYYNGKSWCHNIKILDEEGNVKYSKRAGFRTPEEAMKSAADYEEAYKEERRKYHLKNKIDINVSIKDYLIYWFDEVYSSRVEATSRMIGQYALYYLIFPRLEKNIKLRYANVEYYNSLLKKVSDICPSAGNKGREILNIAMKDAMVVGYISYNPIPETVPYPRKKPEVKILSKQQIKLLLQAAENDRWYLEILLGMFCGLRKGEILGLKFSDFDMENETVSIVRQLGSNPVFKKVNSLEGTYSCVEKPPKSEKSYRTIRVPKIIMRELEARKLRTLADKNRMKERYIDNDYISCRENGLHHSQSSMNIALNKLCDRNGLPRISVHSLRHIYATLLIEKKVPLVKVSALMGHESIHTTFEVYCDVIGEEDNIMDFMNSTFVPVANGVDSDDRIENTAIHRVESW